MIELNMKALSDLVTDIRTRGIRAQLGQRRFVSAPRTAEERQLRYQEDGFVAGGPLLESHEVDELCAEFDRIFPHGVAIPMPHGPATSMPHGSAAATPPPQEVVTPTPHGPAVRGTHAGNGAPQRLEHTQFKDGIGGEYYAVYDLYRHSRAFEDVVRHPRLAEMVAELTGCNALRIFKDQIQYKPATTGGWNGWHRDMPSFPAIRPYTAMTAWIPLDDATEENGCLQMVPGSHTWGDASDIAGEDWGLPRLPDIYHGHPVKRVSRPVRRGHVHFHHELTWHCSSPNKTNHKRRALAILIIGADARYREGGKIVFPELAQGDSFDKVAPIVVTAGG